MGLLDKITESTLGLKGVTPSVLDQSLPTSTLHNSTSINGIPSVAGKKPSTLDLDGKSPKKYLDSAPR